MNISADIKESAEGKRPTPPSGYKMDAGKLRFDLVPPAAVEALAWVLTWACERTTPPPYPERNWEKGMKWTRVFAGVMRHLWQWRQRHSTDPESAQSHLWHALTGIAFLVTYEQLNIGEDDR